MPKQTRQKQSTVANLVAVASSSNVKVEPPMALNAEELAIFEGIINSREKNTWSDHDLREAGKLAQLQNHYEHEWTQLMSEGSVTMNQRGTEIENPRNRVCMTLQGTIKALSSALGLTASQRGVSGNKQAHRNEREITSQRAKTADDDLLA
jgi:phage terminase small subunit